MEEPRTRTRPLAALLQRVIGAALVPVSQLARMNTYPPERQGWAMSYWSTAIIIATIIGPVLGGGLTMLAEMQSRTAASAKPPA